MKWIFTFCCGHDHQHHGRFVRIEADDYGSAREKMIGMFGNDWAFQYTEEEYAKAMARLPEFFREKELILDDK